MDTLMSTNVVLVVKAANQKIEDQTVECGIGWTVKQLKQHLSQVHPSKPRENHQRLIYSGKLLQDNSTLKDVLAKIDENSQMQHTVHMVCSTSPEQKRLEEHNNATGTTVHKRNFNIPESRIPQPVPPTQPMMDATNLAYSPEQMMWMQQIYAQQWSQLMAQYYSNLQNVSMPPTTEPPIAAASTITTTADNVNNPLPNEQQIPRNDEQPIRMNAGPGAPPPDDDDFQNNDWLDKVYTLCRLSLFLFIVYLYSNWQRFALVLVVTLFLYIYHLGWFTPQRRNNNNNNTPNNTNTNSTNEENRDGLAQRTTSFLRILATFVIGFVSSIFPAQNAN